MYFEDFGPGYTGYISNSNLIIALNNNKIKITAIYVNTQQSKIRNVNQHHIFGKLCTKKSPKLKNCSHELDKKNSKINSSVFR